MFRDICIARSMVDKGQWEHRNGQTTGYMSVVARILQASSGKSEKQQQKETLLNHEKYYFWDH